MDDLILSPAPLPSLVVVIVLSVVAGGRGGGLVAGVLLFLLVLLLLLLMELVQGLVLVVHIVGGSGGGVGGCNVGRGTVCSRSGMVVLHSGCSSNDLVRLSVHVGVGKRLTVYDGIETVNRVGRVLDSATEAIGIVQGVFALHHIAVTRLYLALGITRHSILHVVGEVVLGMRIIGIDLVSVGVGVRMGMNIMGLLVDHMLRLWCCGVIKLWLLVLLQLNESSRDGCHEQRDECEKL